MIYYKRLNRKKREDIKKQFLESNESIAYKKALKIISLSILGIVLAICAGIFDYINKTGIFNYILDIILLLSSSFFLIKMIRIRNHEINKYALSKKKEESKEK